jgi:hypothetical protein
LGAWWSKVGKVVSVNDVMQTQYLKMAKISVLPKLSNVSAFKAGKANDAVEKPL